MLEGTIETINEVSEMFGIPRDEVIEKLVSICLSDMGLRDKRLEERFRLQSALTILASEASRWRESQDYPEETEDYPGKYNESDYASIESGDPNESDVNDL